MRLNPTDLFDTLMEKGGGKQNMLTHPQRNYNTPPKTNLEHLGTSQVVVYHKITEAHKNDSELFLTLKNWGLHFPSAFFTTIKIDFQAVG